MASQGGECEPTNEYPSSSSTATANESELTQPYDRSQQDPLDRAFKSMILKIARQLDASNKETICFLYSDQLDPDGKSMSGLSMLDKLEKAGVFHAQNITDLINLLKQCGRLDIVHKYVTPYRKTVHDASEPTQENHGEGHL